MRSTTPRLLTLVESFFRDHLQGSCGASPHTVKSYRDSLRLFFNFIADTRKCAVSDLSPEDMRVEVVVRFLSHLESKRANSVSSRNARLAAIRTFFKHLLRQDLSHPDQYQRVLALDSKRSRTLPASYLEPEDVRLILKQPDQSTPQGARDRALLLFLYNTGARISETLAVRVSDLSLAYPKQVRLHGKGNKDRLCPLWRETTDALRHLPSVRDGRPGDLVFRNARGRELTRDGAAYIPAKARCGRRSQRSSAVAMLQGGNDITVIRDYLGHSSISTTSRYIATNLKMKREALEMFWKRARLPASRSTAWKPTPDLLAFLDSL